MKIETQTKVWEILLDLNHMIDVSDGDIGTPKQNIVDILKRFKAKGFKRPRVDYEFDFNQHIWDYWYEADNGVEGEYDIHIVRNKNDDDDSQGIHISLMYKEEILTVADFKWMSNGVINTSIFLKNIKEYTPRKIEAAKPYTFTPRDYL